MNKNEGIILVSCAEIGIYYHHKDTYRAYESQNAVQEDNSMSKKTKNPRSVNEIASCSMFSN